MDVKAWPSGVHVATAILGTKDIGAYALIRSASSGVKVFTLAII